MSLDKKKSSFFAENEGEKGIFDGYLFWAHKTKRKETPCASLFVLLMENLKQRPPEEVVGSSGAAPPGADAAAALDPQPRHWRAAAAAGSRRRG